MSENENDSLPEEQINHNEENVQENSNHADQELLDEKNKEIEILKAKLEEANKPVESKIGAGERGGVKRIIKGEEQVHHDLFRLENAQTRKNISFTKVPLWEPIDHKHFFHTIDSDGKPQDKCAPSAGHFHYVKTKVIDEKLVAECGPPMKMAMVTNEYGQKKRKAIAYKNDSHSHDLTYLQSEIVTRRVFSADAMEAISRITNRDVERMKNPLV